MIKIGDRVKITRCRSWQPDKLIGTTGTIDREGLCDGMWYIGNFLFDEDEFVLVCDFTTPAPEPEVARSQQYLMDRLSEIENSEDEHWLGAL
jgi:hypothetical protein